MWVALLQDITFLLPSSSTKGTEDRLYQRSPMKCPIVAAQALPFCSQTPELTCNQAEPLLNFVPPAVIQGLQSLVDAISPNPPTSAGPHPGRADSIPRAGCY